MQQIGEVAKLYVWFQIIASIVVLPIVLYIVFSSLNIFDETMHKKQFRRDDWR
jgi:hypothetical protein